jgi:hypothetical protein
MTEEEQPTEEELPIEERILNHLQAVEERQESIEFLLILILIPLWFLMAGMIVLIGLKQWGIL